MPKFVLPIGDNNWDHNKKCNLCKAIDNQYDYIFKMAKMPNMNMLYYKQQIDILDEMVVNGYELPHVYEANSAAHKFVSIDMPTYTDDIKNFAISTFGITQKDFNEYERRKPTLYFSRFCRDCGARKPDIFNTEQLEQFHVDFTCSVGKDLHSINVLWNHLSYDFKYTVKLYRKTDLDVVTEHTDKNAYTLIKTYTDRKINTYKDTDVTDGRAYYYKIQYIDEYGIVFIEKWCHTLNKIWYNHIPKSLRNVKYKKHRRLVKNDKGLYEFDDYIYATYDVNKDDKDFGNVFFKVNSDHVPSVDYFVDDYVFQDHGLFRIPNRKKKYFVKPYIRSRLFKKDWDNDHQIYPDLYFWNTDQDADIIKYTPFEEDIYDLTFEDGYRSMKINFKIKMRHTVKYVRILFKQSKEYITDEDDTYKVVDVYVQPALYDYEVNIKGLAGNSYWVFGCFPVYEDSDPDIRIEYQTIVKIKPWFNEHEWFDDDFSFYYTGYWYKHHDFDKYNLPSIDKVITANSRDKEVFICDGLKKKQVAPLLIQRNECSELFTLEFDFKMLAKTQLDRFHNYVNFKRQLKVVDTSLQWLHFKESFYNQEYMYIRFEQMKMCNSIWTCTMVDNVHITNQTMIDDKTDNFTRTDEIKFTDYIYYNRRVKHNRRHQHTPKKFSQTIITMNPYIDITKAENGDGIDKEYIVGVPDENFDWIP